MSWTVHWSESVKAGLSEEDVVSHVYLAIRGEEEALRVACEFLNQGLIVWSIRRDHGILEMDRHRIFHHFNPLTS
ncbi:hypothetical protein ASG51_00080 [Methylobacterium sp. Leaf465]|jgi:hypothetical protein|uniref:hypothetical protein n=1 Tax=unclassified Methylobacterium TaxID=2615210 RepID=UPI000701C50B|nr:MULTISPECIES: hypothetical protein [unclassified Methylobacterium]KQT84542.1 hypothetical protein ASG51_00080 [Methylobacterium sp. Leaf465]KQU35075.1 hypothetical protein ASG63_00010 [Methylobacterium sp. Leaf94]